MKTAVKSSKKKAIKKASVQQAPLKYTKFGIWCMERKITQKEIRDNTYLSYGSINNMWHIGKSNESTILLVSLIYKLKFDELQKMITTFSDSSVD